MKTAIYTNIKTNETYEISGIKELSHAWLLSKFVCKRNNWNFNMFSNDVLIKLKS